VRRDGGEDAVLRKFIARASEEGPDRLRPSVQVPSVSCRLECLTGGGSNPFPPAWQAEKRWKSKNPAPPRQANGPGLRNGDRAEALWTPSGTAEPLTGPHPGGFPSRG